MRIYTKTGDDGTTGLLYGSRVAKDDLAVEAYGAVDEIVAHLGTARALAGGSDAGAQILRIQRDLFVVGADLAVNPAERAKLTPGVSLVTSDMVHRLEELIDTTVAQHPLPQAFIVPGANPASAALDVARTDARRAERKAVRMRAEGREVNQEALRYLNRLSDLLFVLARAQAGDGEALSREA